MSLSPESNEDTGAAEEKTSLFEVVVKIRREVRCGKRSSSCCLKCVIDAELAIGRDSVNGRPRPGKEVNKMLIVWGAIASIPILRKTILDRKIMPQALRLRLVVVEVDINQLHNPSRL